MKLCISTVALAAVLAFTAPAAAGEVSEFMDRFRLGNGCLPVPLVVEGLDKDATRIGLTGKAITITVRSRLRAARIYTEKGARRNSMWLSAWLDLHTMLPFPCENWCTTLEPDRSTLPRPGGFGISVRTAMTPEPCCCASGSLRMNS